MKGSIFLKGSEEKAKLDEKNQQILQMLIEDSRASITKISKKIGISKPATLQRINQLKNNGIILQHIAYYNVKSFQHYCHMVLLEVDATKEDIIIGKLNKCQYSAAIIKLASNYNILWMVYSRDNEPLSQIIKECRLSQNVRDMQIYPIARNYFDSYNLFVNEDKKIQDRKQENFKLDKNDLEILKILKDNSRISLVDIAKKIDLTAEAIKHRVSKLYSSGVILRLFTNFNIFKLGFQPHFVLLKTNRIKQREIIDFVRRYQNTNGQYVLDSSFDVACALVVKDIADLRKFIDKIHERFPKNILEYQTYLITDQFLSDFFPNGVYDYLVKSISS